MVTKNNKNNKTDYKTDCIGQCHRLKGYCTGCGRTSEEIFDWIILSEAEKQIILDAPRHDSNKQADKK
ncbi:DUF1289 domain-containing protein [Pseudoalteromonas shioyasakiensis]|uniref:DUF1289 domain-containing protein n=1 Tax=Pseudoalteromonas shioyasakiensis TaxID=1190813 RepID=UPI002119281D|nr:DUF1289 domain-containing protein [Pseudoalteromonas shioyasakiensis]MCQ8878375.1 DUF1289 domain-containing protein [Pseudoalteromonas shioyasakiensis]